MMTSSSIKAATIVLTLAIRHQSTAFTTVSYYHHHHHHHQNTISSIHDTQLYSSVLNDASGPVLDENLQEINKEYKEPEYEILDFVLHEHKPLGCTAEESLAPEPDMRTPVFVSKVVEGGNAEKAGIAVGDVILGITGVFDEIEDVTYSNLERVRALVSGRYPEQSLTIRVMRGTDVMERHESVLVSLCSLPADDNVEECISSIMKDESLDELIASTNARDDDGEGMLDAMSAFWGTEQDIFPTAVEEEKEAKKPVEKKKNNPRPWANRSSPSGTFVRDPATGKLVNIG